MNKKFKVILVISVLTLCYIFMLSYFHIEHSNSLKEFNKESYESFNTLQNVIHKIHNEDSLLYKTLLSKEILNSNKENSKNKYSYANHSSNIISKLLDLKENNEFSSQKLASRIDEYYSLENLRNKIIELHKQSMINTNKNYNNEISIFLSEYESQMSIILTDMNEEITLSKESSLLKQEEILLDFLHKELISLTYYVFSIILILYFFNFHKEFQRNKEEKENTQILDEDMRKIITYVKKEVKQGNFPTIKELKFYLKISHPTLLLKLTKLEKDNLISIKKEGRNKYVFIK